MSYQTSVYDALANAGRIVKETNCQAVKLEGGIAYADRIRAIVEAGIPVVAHIGLTPQSFNTLGGWPVRDDLEPAEGSTPFNELHVSNFDPSEIYVNINTVRDFWQLL